ISNLLNDTVLVFKVTDICGDSDTDSVKVSVATQIKLSTSDTTVNCPATSFNIRVNASGGSPQYTYTWSNGGTNSFINVSPANTIIYTVTVRDSCGSSAIDTVRVTVNDIPLTAKTRDTTINCNGTGNLNALVSGGGGGYSYGWSNGATTSSINVSPEKDTAYYVTVSCPCGNQKVTDTVKVTVIPPGFTLTTTPDTRLNCPDDTITLKATPNPAGNCYLYAWSNGMTASSISVHPNFTSTYTVNVTDTCCNSGNKNSSITISIPPISKLTVSTFSDSIVVCSGDVVNLMAAGIGGNGVISYQWHSDTVNADTLVNPDSSHAYLRGFAPNVFEVVVKDQCGDVDSDRVL
ncbi:MAG: hypothetical protein ACREF7_00705, partial [Candidatus Saccharimonadales bacterium]